MSNFAGKNNFFKVSKIKIILICLCIFIFAFGVGYYVSFIRNFKWTQDIVSGIVPVRENNFNYQFIYPLLGYKFGNARYLMEDKDLEQQINTYVQNQYQNNTINNISVFYRNFLNNKWAGVNADVQFHPGSMMKVLVMMAYFREAQLDPSILQQNLIYSDDINKQISVLNYGQNSNLVVGQSYTVDQLIQTMIKDSDNGANDLLLKYINHKILDDVFNDFNIKNPDATTDFTISTTQYSDFLRILYNSTYLSEINSEKALSIMNKSTFHDGISAGVPTGVNVAQKYGEYVDTDALHQNIKNIELSNCGIVYFPNNPYEVCINVKGSYSGDGHLDEQKLASIIKDISSIIYNYINNKK
ncbi:MAG: serine hydrolase [Patescibacteria group bacterium]|nr:serine hydrolase [Patescibacteria group bacterium]